MARTEPITAPGAPRTAWRRHARLLATVAGLSAAVLGWGVFVDAVGSATTATVSVGSAAGFGDILIDAQGLPLYTLNTDHGGQSTCTASCLQAWPPLTVTPGTTPSAGPGVPGTLGAATQADGRDQVTYDGMPLYTFAGDSPGQVNGQGVSGFTVVQVTPSTAPTTTTAVPGASTGVPSSPTTVGSAAASGTPQPGAAATAATPASGTPTPAATPAAAATAPSTASAPAQSAGALATTGPGPGLWVVAMVGLALVALGAVMSLGTRLRDSSR